MRREPERLTVLRLPRAVPGGKHLHYLFYTSQTGNANDPLILWFNGGPGCSSLEGAFSESGPLWTTSGGIDLQVNGEGSGEGDSALKLTLTGIDLCV